MSFCPEKYFYRNRRKNSKISSFLGIFHFSGKSVKLQYFQKVAFFNIGNYEKQFFRIDQPCGIHYVDKYVGPNQKCTLTINSGVAYPHFITLGGVFVTSQMSPGDYQYYFHTYDQFAGASGGYDAAGGVDVTIFWHNPSFPDETTECLNADQVCITCQPETSDVDGDGMAGPVPGVYLGTFSN